MPIKPLQDPGVQIPKPPTQTTNSGLAEHEPTGTTQDKRSLTHAMYHARKSRAAHNGNG